MKKFKKLTEELFTEGGEMYPADDMTMKEIKIACYAAQNILDRLEDGQMIQRWQISAIVKAKEELASVYTSMSADEEDDDEMDWDEEEPMYVGFEYPSMYEETELDEGFKEKIKGMIRREKEKEYPLVQNRRDVAHNKAAAAYAAGDQKKGDRYMKWRDDNMKKEEVDLDEATSDHWKNDTLSGKYRLKNGGHAIVSKHPKPGKWNIEWSDGINNHVNPHDTRTVKAWFKNDVKEEVELDEASYRDIGARNMLKADRKAEREVAKMRAQAAKRAEKEATKKKPVEEEAELDETSAFFHSEMDKLSKKAHADAAEKSKKTGPITSKTLADINAKLGTTKKTNEETDYEVDVEGLPKMYVKGDNPSQVKNNLRKVVKNPEMIRGVERVAKATLQKIFRDKASGKDDVTEEVDLDEDTMPSNVANRLSDRHFTAAFTHKKNGNMKGYAAHLKVANRIEDAIIRAGSHMPIKSKQIEAASDKAFKEHPHRTVKTEDSQLDEVSKNTLKSYITKKSQQIIDKDDKADPYGVNSGGSSKERNRDFDKLNLARRKLKD